MQQAQICRWRENHGRGWGSAINYGLRMEIDGDVLLVSRLSHGLRAFRLASVQQLEFIGKESPVDVPDEFVEAIRIALAADDEFRKWTSNFELLMTH